MSYKKVISLCFYRRPKYAQQVVNALRECDGIQDYKLVFSLDGPINNEVLKICNGVNWIEREVLTSKSNLSCNGNTRKALSRGFEMTDYLIHVEEDIVLAKDALRYFEWGRRFEGDKQVYTIGAWRHPSGWLPKHGRFPAGQNIGGKVSKHGGLWIWGWATWKDRWLDMDRNWTTKGDKVLSWDTCLTRHRHATGRYALVPYVSRAINIGAEAGTHTGATILDYWAGSPGFKIPETYQRVDLP